MKHLSEMSKAEAQEAFHLQAYIEQLADVEYQCYYKKINRREFWRKYLWERLQPYIVALEGLF